MKHAAVCFASTIFGALTVCWMFSQTPSISSASAQISSLRPYNGGARLSSMSSSAESRSNVPQLSMLPPRVYNGEGLTPDEAASVYVYESNDRSVANIATRVGAARVMFLENPTSDAGSGFVLDQQGHVLTNYHVVEGAQRIQVTLFDGESYEAEMVGADPINDMAVVKVTAPPEMLYPVRFGDSSTLKVGMRVFAIGNPFGLERTMTTGIISSLNRTLPVTRARSIKSVIQIDAPINPGNSGGPLLNSHGELIGMNTAIASKTGQSSGIGFAIPVNLIRRVMPELIQHGRVLRPDSGILEVMKTDAGLRILRLDSEGAASKAGLKGPQTKRVKRGFVTFESEDRTAADLIVGVNGKKTLQVDEFLSEVESHRPGDQIRIEVIRDGQPLSVPLTLK